MSTHVDIPTAADLMGVSAGHVRRLCIDGKLPGATRSGRTWQIPRTAHPALAERRRTPPAAGDLSHVPPDKLEAAAAKRRLIEQCADYCTAAAAAGAKRTQAMAAFARQADVPPSSLYHWQRQWRRHGLAGLIDKRGGDAPGQLTITPDAWQEFLSLYLDPRRPSVRQCWQIVCHLNDRHARGWTLPSLRRMQQLVAERIPLPVAVLHREGLAAYEAKCAPYIETDMDSIEPGAVWIGDHHQCDCWVRHRGAWIRPWITAWEDMRSRAIVGWCITSSPNSTTILHAFRRGCEQYGPPESVKIDNGKDYDSELFTGTTKQRRRLNLKLDRDNIAGLYALLDIRVSFAIPYHPQAKSIERWFDTLESQYVRTLPTYCGKDPARRPEALAAYLKTDRALRESLELDAFASQVGDYIALYNRTPHTGRGMDGRAPLEVLHTRRARRMICAETLDLLCRVWTGERTVGKNGVKVRGLWYGTYDPALLMHQGRKVRCAYDPDDMTQVRVYDARSYAYLTTAQQPTLVGYGAEANEDDLRAASRQKARARKLVKQYKPAARIAATQLPHLTLQAAADRARPEADEPSKPVRPVATPLDGQAAQVRRTERTRAVKRAAGAEGTEQVIDLDWDWDEPTEPQRPLLDLGLDDEFDPAPQAAIRLEWDDE